MTVVSSQATNRGTGAGWRGWGGVLPTVCSVQGGESAANGVQLVGEAAEAVMSGFCILVLIMVMRQIHRITVRV